MKALCGQLPGVVGTRGLDLGFGLSCSVSVRFPLISIETLMASHLLSASCLPSLCSGREILVAVIEKPLCHQINTAEIRWDWVFGHCGITVVFSHCVLLSFPLLSVPT